MALTDENGSGMVMPVAPMYGGGYGNQGGMGFGGDGWWVLLILLAMGGWGNGFGGGFGGGFGNMQLGYDFPWLLNGQNQITASTADGFRTAQLSDGITSIRDGINGLSTQLCNCCGDIQMSLANGFAGVEQGANARQIANMQTAFAGQTAMAQGFTGVNSGLADLKYTVATENCADRAALSDGIKDLLSATQAQTQTILTQLCNDKLEAKNDLIAQLRSELQYARGQASQDVQTARLLAGQTAEVDALYNRLSNCPVPTVPVYGRQPIFTCNSGCGCSGNSGFIG